MRRRGLQEVRAVTHVKAREWIKRLPERAGDDVDAGCKGLLQAMWDHILWEIEHTTTGTSREPGHSCWASAETLAGEIGSTERAVSDRQGKLSKAGWIRRDGRGWAMAWAVPFTPECRAKKRTRKHRSVTDSTPECLATSTAVSDEQHRGVTKRTHEPSNQPSNEPPQRAGEPAPVEGHPCTVEDSPEVTPASPNRPEIPETSQPAKPRKRKPPKPRQQGFDLPDPDPIDPLEIAHAELLADHERLRAEAFAHHREKLPAWPAPFTGSGKAIRAGLRQALRDHGPDVCRAALERRAAEWRGSVVNAIKHSLDNMWSASSLVHVLPGSTRARASPTRGLPVEPDAPDRTYRFE
jgi:hypothetical protein